MSLPEPKHPLAKGVVRGDVRALARVCRLVDDGVGEHLAILKQLFPFTGKAWTVGVTGTPGAGKSTLTDKLIAVFREQGKRVGVVAIDPTSPFTGGALLGDRIRMQRHFADAEVFIRSVATRGALGGLSRSAADIVRVLDAWQADVVLVETVGVGQDELEVTRTADTTLVIMAPGMGDEIQAIKAGILECADVFAVNKCDRDGADATERDLQLMIALGQSVSSLGAMDTQGHHAAQELAGSMTPAASEPAESPELSAWHVPVVRCVATLGQGVEGLVDQLEAHREWLRGTEAGRARSLERLRDAMRTQLRNTLIEYAEATMNEAINETVQAVARREIDPYTASEQLLQRLREQRLKGA